MSKQDLHILDVTVRQGGFMVHNHLLKEQVADIAKGLQDSGVRHMEVSHGRGIGAKRAGYPGLFPDAELLKAAKDAAPELKLTAYVSPHAYSIFELESVAEYCDAFRLSIDFDEISKAKDNLSAIRKTGVKAIALLERAHRFSPEEVAQAFSELEQAGAEGACLADTFGSMDAAEVGQYIQALRDKTRAPIGFQGFNTTGRAVGNCIGAVQAGADWLDASLLGLGPSGGMAPVEILTALAPRLERKIPFDLRRLSLTGRWYALPALRYLPTVRTADLVLAKLKMDYYPVEFLERLAGILEMDIEAMLREIDAIKGPRARLKEVDLRDFLASQQIDFDVVVQYIQTGKVPGAEVAS